MPREPEFQFDIFLSHNSKDKPRVRKLAERLRAAGARVWFDEWVVKPGDDIYLAIERGLEASRTMVLCLSPAALGSDWVGLERSTVLFRDPSNAGRRFVPVLLADCDLPDTLRRYKYVEFRRGSEAAFEELLSAWRAGITMSVYSWRSGSTGRGSDGSRWQQAISHRERLSISVGASRISGLSSARPRRSHRPLGGSQKGYPAPAAVNDQAVHSPQFLGVGASADCVERLLKQFVGPPRPVGDHRSVGSRWLWQANSPPKELECVYYRCNDFVGDGPIGLGRLVSPRDRRVQPLH